MFPSPQTRYQVSAYVINKHYIHPYWQLSLVLQDNDFEPQDHDQDS